MSQISYPDHMIAEMKRRTGRPNVRNNGGFEISPWPPKTGKPGSRHNGVDIAGLLQGTPIPTLPGEILHAGRIPNASRDDATYGNTVFLWPDSRQDIVWQFAHARSTLVKTGDLVKWEQEIYTQGGSGATGLNTYGIHTHLEARRYEATYHNQPWRMFPRLDPEKVLFDVSLLKGEFDARTHCVVGFSEADAPTLMSLVQVLRRQDDCPIYYRNTMTKALAKYQTIYGVGGTEDDIRKLAPTAKIVMLSGPGRLETAAEALKQINKIKLEDKRK